MMKWTVTVSIEDLDSDMAILYHHLVEILILFPEQIFNYYIHSIIAHAKITGECYLQCAQKGKSSLWVMYRYAIAHLSRQSMNKLIKALHLQQVYPGKPNIEPLLISSERFIVASIFFLKKRKRERWKINNRITC